MKPFISIILATYNRIKTIDRAVNSVLNQDFKSWELIIIDDGSKPNANGLPSTIIDLSVPGKNKIIRRGEISETDIDEALTQVGPTKN